MTFNLNRRQLISASVAAGAVALVPTGIVAFLSQPDAVARIFAMLEKRLGLTQQHLAFIGEFTSSLLTSATHSPAKPHVKERLANLPAADHHEDLEAYVLQEFIISTNYLSYRAGRAPALKILPFGPNGYRVDV